MLRPAVFALAAISAHPLHAQQPGRPEITVEGGLAATSNGGLRPRGDEKGDVIASVRPRLELARRGPRLEYQLAASLGLVAYADGTQSSSLQPELRGFLRSELVERWFHLDAAVDVGQSERGLYGSRVDDVTGANRRTASAFRASPYVLRDLSSSSYVLARHDIATTDQGAGSGNRLLSNRTLLRYEMKPVPLGAAFELVRLDNETRGDDATSRLTLETARASGSLAIRNQLIVGALAGVERSDFESSSHTDPLYGVSALWNPGPRTSFNATLEHRFFGLGGSLEMRHRTPLMSFAIAVRRGPVVVPSTLGQLDEGSDLRPSLDAILTTRHPDPTTRRGLVQSLVWRRGLDVRVPNPVYTVASYPQLQTSANATWALLGGRNTAALTLYTQTLRELTHDGDPASAGDARDDNRQAGASFQFNRRLTPQLSAEALVRWSMITGLAAREGESSREWIYRLAVSRALSLRTGISAGVQHNQFSSNASGQNDYKATLAFVGLRHRF